MSTPVTDEGSRRTPVLLLPLLPPAPDDETDRVAGAAALRVTRVSGAAEARRGAGAGVARGVGMIAGDEVP